MLQHTKYPLVVIITKKIRKLNHLTCIPSQCLSPPCVLFFVGKLNFNDQGRKPRHALCTLILPWVLFLHASRFFLIIFYISCIQWYHMMKKYFKMGLKRTSCRNDYYLLHHSDSRLINLYPFIIGIACVCVCVSTLILKLYLGNDFHAIMILIINKIQWFISIVFVRH